MKKRFVAAALILAAAVILYFFLSSKNPAPAAIEAPPRESSNTISGNIPVTTSKTASSASNISSPSEGTSNLAARAGERLPDSAPVKDLSEETVMQNIRRSVRQYGATYGGNPVGTNPEITSALNGKNPRHIYFLNTDGGLRINGDGAMVDEWGTPYFFHQLSGTEMEIHSAGPDKIMWTSDDLVVR